MKKNNFGKYLSCSKCQREFSTRSSFEKHFQAHSKFTCENGWENLILIFFIFLIMEREIISNSQEDDYTSLCSRRTKI